MSENLDEKNPLVNSSTGDMIVEDPIQDKNVNCCDSCCCFGQCNSAIGLVKVQSLFFFVVLCGMLLFMWRMAYMLMTLYNDGTNDSGWIIWSSLTLSLTTFELLAYLVAFAGLIHAIVNRNKCCSVMTVTFLWTCVCLYILDLAFWCTGVAIGIIDNSQGYGNFFLYWCNWVDAAFHVYQIVYQGGLLLLAFWVMKKN